MVKTIVIGVANGLTKAKKWARYYARTLRALVERRLKVLGKPATSTRPFKPVTGRLEPLPGVDPYDWDAILDSVYDMTDRV